MKKTGILFPSTTKQITTMTIFDQARMNMVDCQIATGGITEHAILEAFAAVPREQFLPENLKTSAYLDEDLAIAPRQFLIEPLVHARLIQALAPKTGERAFVMGDPTGYGAAILAKFGVSLSGAAPYDLVVVQGAVSETPLSLSTQLARGGRMVCILRRTPKEAGRIHLIERNQDGAFSSQDLADASTPWIAGYEPQPKFAFK
jgi:protein-L-isoaspartate(D-aspartate) O-methyltransferase